MCKLYTTKCPKCIVLERKLKEKGVEFEVVDNLEEVTKMANSIGVSSVPFMVVDNKFMDYRESINWANGGA